ncbi:unnamed protein product [Schistocephalus solidus]|uniref:N-acetylglucosaminylphosphatidylinositol deacetylase n=1 Tax=Schistocephalus solidus TaxID=70667 RepID=A0A183T942_SCHSO|nr:unnamed protein product [Schistocephalus solidus]
MELTNPGSEVPIYWVSVLICGCIIVYVILRAVYKTKMSKEWRINEPILLITAHPDDECMFFAPFLLSMKSMKVKVDLLCLSRGDYYGSGEQRLQELHNSVRVLGINRVKVVNDPLLPDDPSVAWPLDKTTKYIRSAAKEWQSKLLVTFDSYGVSGHKNHRQIYAAVREFCALEKYFKAVMLRSHFTVLKYCLPLSLFLTCFHSPVLTFYSPFWSIFSAHKAMLQHRSQLVWFRYLYIVFSFYMYGNTFKVFR